MRHAVIMAGGAGTRLWPISRASTPKQFQKLLGERTLIQQTFDRISETIDPKNIWVVTGEQYQDLVKEQLPQVVHNHVIAEPIGRNTAPATLIATLKILSEDENATLFGLLPADHYVGKKNVFTSATKAAFEFIEKNPTFTVTIGIHPDEPNTGLGYIKMGEILHSTRSKLIKAVESFHEKPDSTKALEFVESGDYLWNGGYYLFAAKEMVENFRRYSPKILTKVMHYLESPSLKRYREVPSESLDIAIAEKVKKLAVIPVEMDWSDIGNWATLHEILVSKGKNSQVATANHLGDSTENSLVLGGSKLIVTVGIKDVVVVDTDDVILICDKGSVQDVKKVVEQLKKQGKEELI